MFINLFLTGVHLYFIYFLFVFIIYLYNSITFNNKSHGNICLILLIASYETYPIKKKKKKMLHMDLKIFSTQHNVLLIY